MSKTITPFWVPLSRFERRFLIAALVVLLSLLAACDLRPEHAEWQSQCSSSHMEYMMLPMMTPGPNGTSTTTLQMQPYDVCDAYVPVCVAGKDGSTTCETKKVEQSADVSGVIGQM